MLFNKLLFRIEIKMNNRINQYKSNYENEESTWYL